MVHTKARISSGLVMWGLNGPCGSSGFLVIETNRNKQQTESIMKKAAQKDAGAETLTARKTLMIFQPRTNVATHGVELRT